MKLYEKKLQNELMMAIGSRPWCRLWRHNVGVFRRLHNDEKVSIGLKGQSDIFGILQGGSLVCIEVKSATGRESEHQRNWGAMVERFGGVYVVARLPKDTDDDNLEEKCDLVVRRVMRRLLERVRDSES